MCKRRLENMKKINKSDIKYNTFKYMSGLNIAKGNDLTATYPDSKRGLKSQKTRYILKIRTNYNYKNSARDKQLNVLSRAPRRFS